MSYKEYARETEIQTRTDRCRSPSGLGPVMYQLGLKPLPHVPPRTMSEDVRMGWGEEIGALACKPQMSFLQPSRSLSFTAVSKVSRRSSDPKQ